MQIIRELYFLRITMTYRFLFLPALCLTLIFGCEPDRRAAQGEGYVEEDEGPVVDTTEDFEYGLEIDGDPVAATGLDQEAYQFIIQAARGSMLEVEMAEIAQEKARMQEVKDFAQMLENDHQQINEQLKELAQEEEGFAFPEMMAEMQEEILEELRNKSGDDFDRAYVERVLELHQINIRQFQAMLDEIQNQELQSWINSTLTELRQHKQQAEQILDQIEQ